jgi:hypothetical protein
MKVKAKRVVGVFLILLFLCGLGQFFVPVTEGQQSNLVVDRAFWVNLANNAWRYYQPGVGVDSKTGLHSSAWGWPYFTDWDLGVYIQAVIDANQLGILSNDGNWGANARFDKILTFLETRQLTSDRLPYSWYKAADGNMYVDETQNAADAGELLVSLNNLKIHKPDLANDINNIVYNRTNYAPLQTAVDALKNSKNLYDYYVASGFAGFWPSRFSSLTTIILNNILSAPTVMTYGVTLPKAKINCEPLFLSVFNLSPSAKLDSIADIAYLAHEARYNATGKFSAFSEGNSGINDIPYVYEWLVKEDGSTWTIDYYGTDVNISPIIYFKSAVGFLAMHDTVFTEKMVSTIASLSTPISGYWDGVDENGRIDINTGDKTNSIILGAALYAINNLQNPSSSPTPTPISGNPTSTPSTTLTPGRSPSPSPTPNPSTSTTPSPSSSTNPSPPGPSLREQLENSYVIIFVVAIIVVGISQFALMIRGSRKKTRLNHLFCFSFLRGPLRVLLTVGDFIDFGVLNAIKL